MSAPKEDQRLAIEGLEQRLARAWVEQDRPFIENLLAPGWTVTDPSGRVLTRQHVLDETFSASNREIDARTVDEVSVKIMGTTAIVTGRTRAAGRYQGQPLNVALRFTDVLQLVDGEWKIVVSHGTFIAS